MSTDPSVTMIESDMLGDDRVRGGAIAMNGGGQRATIETAVAGAEDRARHRKTQMMIPCTKSIDMDDAITGALMSVPGVEIDTRVEETMLACRALCVQTSKPALVAIHP